MTTISFFVLGTPVAQPRGRARAIPLKNKSTGRAILDKRGQPMWRGAIYDPGDADLWKRDIKMQSQAFVPETPMVGPVALELTFYMPRPKHHYGTGKNAGKLKDSAPERSEVKPDVENAAKAVMDTLTEMRFWLDDCQVSRLVVDKFYENGPCKPGCQITIVPLENKAARAFAPVLTVVEQPELAGVVT